MAAIGLPCAATPCAGTGGEHRGHGRSHKGVLPADTAPCLSTGPSPPLTYNAGPLNRDILFP